jgi:hypothetical protein
MVGFGRGCGGAVLGSSGLGLGRARLGPRRWLVKCWVWGRAIAGLGLGQG